MENVNDENGNAKVSDKTIQNATSEHKVLETEAEKSERFKSLHIIYFTLLLESMGVSITMSGIYPYLKKLNPTSSKGFYSIIVAANPFGLFIFSPLIGYWTNKSASIRIPNIVILIIFIISNALYSSLDLIGHGVKYWMLIIRFMTGIPSSTVAIGRSYISAATTVDERTQALSMASLAQVIGLIIGVLLQSVFTAIGDGFALPGGWRVSMYTMPGWVNVLFGVANVVIFMPGFFKDHNIAVREHMLNQEKDSRKNETIKLDHVVIWSLIFSYFVISFNVVIMESLMTPLAMEQFTFTGEEAIRWNSILMGIGAILSIVIFSFLPRFSKMFKEVDILIWAGFFIVTIGKIIYIPYRNNAPKLASDRLFIFENGTAGYYDDDHYEVLGCPVKTQPWCEYTPALGIPEYIVGNFLGVIGYPIGVTLIQTIFSKILGARPQGTWMGIMLAAGSLCRIVGPMIVMDSYAAFGTIWTFIWISIFMMIPMIIIYALKNRLDSKNPKNEDADLENNNIQSTKV